MISRIEPGTNLLYSRFTVQLPYSRHCIPCTAEFSEVLRETHLEAQRTSYLRYKTKIHSIT